MRPGDYDGAAAIAAAWADGLRPDPSLTVSAWADRHRVLSPRGANEAGPWRTARTPYLKAIMDHLSPSHPCQRVVFMKGAQTGGPLALDTPLPTASGWTTMGAVQIGDVLFDEKGQPCSVTSVSEIMTDRACFEVVFEDGATVVCDAEHRWPVWDCTNDVSVARVLRTDQMLGRIEIGRSRRRRFAVDCCAPVELPDQDLLIHPYVLGVWLGDGSSIMNHISVHEDDWMIAVHLTACGVEADYRRPFWSKGKAANIIIDPTFRAESDGRVAARVQHRSRFTAGLRMLDVLDNKHVPAVYLRASREQRLELVRGLMDSDGSITPDGKRCEFGNTDRRLVDAMIELLGSLGYKPTVYWAPAREGITPGNRRCPMQETWRVTWTAYCEEPMFRLDRKNARLRSIANGRPTKSRRRRIVEIRPVGSVPVRCIAVDSPSHLYLCSKAWIPTHNTEAGNNFLGYVIHHAPGPMLAVQPTVELAKRFSQQRVEPLIEASPMLSERVAPARSRDSGNTVLAKTFPGGILVLTGANSAVGLRSMPARYLFLDEVDAYPPSADAEGDPVALAEARTRTFAWRRKVFLVSTPTIKGSSRIEREYEASDQRRYMVPCPHCGHRQHLLFERLRWAKGQPETAAYRCEGCDEPIEERHKTAMLAGGEWRATATSADPLTVGFHISSLYSPLGWLSWERIARDWLAAQGSDEAIRSFKNGVLGETWQESGEAPDWQQLYDRREQWPAGTVPERGLFLTAGADVQKDRIEVDVWAWGRGLESWLVEHLVIEGGPGSARSWAALDDLLGRNWAHASGALMTLARLAIDTGYEAPAVYSWARRAGFAQVAPVKGIEGFNRASPVSGPTYVDATDGGKRLRRGARLWTVAVSTFKAETYRFLRLDRPTDEQQAAGEAMPAGMVHLPGRIDSEWSKQLVAEQLVTVKTKRGFQKLEWQKLRERNEALDCRVYARAAAWIAGADRWPERKWAEMERELGVGTARPTAATSSGETAPPSRTAATERPADRQPRLGDWLGGRQRNWFAR